MVSSKTLNGHLKTIRSIAVKGFAKVETQLEGLEKKIGDRIDTVERNLEDQIDGVEGRLVGVEGRLTGVEEKVQSLDTRIDGLEVCIDKVENNLTSQIEDLAGMTAREFKAVRSEIAVRNIQADLR